MKHKGIWIFIGLSIVAVSLANKKQRELHDRMMKDKEERFRKEWEEKQKQES